MLISAILALVGCDAVGSRPCFFAEPASFRQDTSYDCGANAENPSGRCTKEIWLYDGVADIYQSDYVETYPYTCSGKHVVIAQGARELAGSWDADTSRLVLGENSYIRN